MGTIYWQNRQVDFAEKFWRGAAAASLDYQPAAQHLARLDDL